MQDQRNQPDNVVRLGDRRPQAQSATEVDPALRRQRVLEVQAVAGSAHASAARLLAVGDGDFSAFFQGLADRLDLAARKA